MEDFITCPICGEPNPPDMTYCQNCQWRLKPLSDEDGSGSQGPAPELPDWLRDARDEAGKSDFGQSSTSTDSGEKGESSADDLLAGLASQSHEEEFQVPDWVARITSSDESAPSTAPGGSDEGPTDAASDVESAPAAAATPDEWSGFQSADVAGSEEELLGGSAGEGGGIAEPTEGENEEIYEWLRNLDSASSQAPQVEAPEENAGPDVPTWVRRLSGGPSASPEAEADETATSLPAWLIEQSEEREGVSRAASAAAAGAGREQGGTPGPSPEELGAPAPASPGPETPSTTTLDSSAAAKEPPTPPTVPAFTADAGTGIDVDAVFASMQMPDWLADVRPAAGAQEEARPPAAQEDEDIQPAELPSWVQALRPAEAASAQAAQAAADQPAEDHGPLVGLHGVLPTIPGAMTPSSKPKAHSLRLEVTDQQRSHAELLEQMLAAESTPIPIRSGKRPASERLLRWSIAAILLTVIGTAVFARTQILPIPVAVPNETAQAIDVVENIPADAPVLIVVDYEPATTGEMEAVAASILDHMLLLQHPRVTLISTSPTGAALGERLMTTTLADRAYARDSQYVNLGYLPGGLAGVQAFARDPMRTTPVDSSLHRVWTSPVLAGVVRLSDFAGIFVLTDNLESGRVWIEQTTLARAQVPMVLIASAQSGPMLLPYVDSLQVQGLVAGLNGAAGAELANSGFPGYVRRYWDGYDLGLYLAAALIVAGALWQALAGMRERNAEQAV